MAAKFLNLPLRLVFSGMNRLRKAIWYFTRPESFGAHAFAFTPARAIILVKLRYARGWRLPGGGVKAGEDPGAAVLRELAEEIGMTAHGDVRLASELQDRADFKRDTSSLFIVREVEYQPKWSMEVEAVKEFPLDRLPPDTSRRTRRWIAALRPMLEAG